MPIIPWACAHGDAEWAIIPCARTTMLGSADSNRVIITGGGSIESFGPSPRHLDRGVPCTKVIFFDPSWEIELVPSDHLALLGSGRRTIRGKGFATFSCDSRDHWTENSFQSLDWSQHDLEALIDVVQELCQGKPSLRRRVEALARKLLPNHQNARRAG